MPSLSGGGGRYGRAEAIFPLPLSGPLAVNVADLTVGDPDSAGICVERIYARNPPSYAVYRTGDRLCMHFADDAAKADEQRKALAQLSPLRGEINGLIDRWREASLDRRFVWIGPKTGARQRARAERYDRQVADALIVALEGDLTGAGVLLKDLKDDITAERVGWARFLYLLAAIGIASAIMLVSIGVSVFDRRGQCTFGQMLCFKDAWNLWLGGLSGAFGAFFSIALALRGRTVLPDLYWTSNVMDAALRVVIGAIAGGVLVGLIGAEFVQVSLGGRSPGTYETIHILVVAFLAGFAERLVPDLLAKGELRAPEPPVIRKPEPELDTSALQRPASGAQQARTAAEDAEDPPDLPAREADEDTCVAGVELNDDEITSDEDLPPASGGVEKAGVHPA